MQSELHTKLKSASDSVSKVTKLFKQAQMGTMGPDDVKEFVDEAVSTLSQVTDTLIGVSEGVPATDSSPEPEPKPDAAPTDEPPAPEKDAEMGSDDPEKDELKNKVASLENKLAEMQRTSELKDIATKYASLWPEKQQAAKHASIMKSKEDIKVLQARLDEAQSLMVKTKTASMGTDMDWRKPSIYKEGSQQKSASMDDGVITNHGKIDFSNI